MTLTVLNGISINYCHRCRSLIRKTLISADVAGDSPGRPCFL